MTRSGALAELTVADRSGPALETQEVIMPTTRRLAAALCALSLTIPAAASAKVADDGPVTPAVKGHVATGDTKGDLIAPTSGNGYVGVTGDTKGDLSAPTSGNGYVGVTGDTKGDLSAPTSGNGYVGVTGDTKGDLSAPTSGNGYVGVTGDTKGDLSAPTSGNGYVDKVGSLSPEQLAAAYGTTRPKVTPVATPASSKSPDNGTDEWRVAAVVEAALLAAFAVGAALALSGRQRRRTAGLGV
jgi:hypothetical protein